jgi:CRISPR-associated endoribonuclease Cas6
MSDAPELTSLVLTVAPTKPVTMSDYLGRAVYRFWLHYLDKIDSSLPQQLHDGQGPKPFTCSSLVGGQRIANHVCRHTPEAPVWFRITGLTATISSHLQQLAADMPKKIELDGVEFRVLSATMNNEDHPWAGQTSVEQISAPFLLSKRQPNYRMKFNFASPTTFRSGGYSQPVPLAGWLFGSLLDRWNAFSPVALSSDVRRFAEECVVLSRYQLRTRAIPYKNIVQTGCIGVAYYNILNRDRYWANILNLLAEFAFYSGVGYQTTVGLGQVQHLAKQ